MTYYLIATVSEVTLYLTPEAVSWAECVAAMKAELARYGADALTCKGV